MNLKESDNIIRLIVCPDCRGKVGKINQDEVTLGFFCDTCGLVFPIKDDIPIILPVKARSYVLEHNLIQNIRKIVNSGAIKGLTEYIDNTQKVLDQYKNQTRWEWEEEEYWTKLYLEEQQAQKTKNWNDRIWQREFLTAKLAGLTSLKEKTILDNGCGEGQNFRLLMSQYCDETSLYIATDISLSGLKLNKMRNTHHNSIYILCSSNNLPLQKQSIDILCYFGILHHTELKANNILKDSELLKNGGYVLLHEPISRPSISSLKNYISRRIGESAHEETLDLNDLMAAIDKSRLEIVTAKKLHTLFFTGMILLFARIIINSKTLFNFVSGLDNMILRLFEDKISYCRAGGIMMLLKLKAADNR